MISKKENQMIVRRIKTEMIGCSETAKVKAYFEVLNSIGRGC